MLIGKVRMIYLLTAMLAVGAGAGFASHEDAMLQVQAAEEAALEENTQTMGSDRGRTDRDTGGKRDFWCRYGRTG